MLIFPPWSVNTLICALLTWPVARDKLYIFTCFPQPTGIEPQAHRTSEHAPIMLQLAAYRLGVCQQSRAVSIR